MAMTPIDYVIVNLLPYLKSTPGKKCSCIRLCKLARISSEETMELLKQITPEELDKYQLSMYRTGGDYMMWYSKEIKEKQLVVRKPIANKPYVY